MSDLDIEGVARIYRDGVHRGYRNGLRDACISLKGVSSVEEGLKRIVKLFETQQRKRAYVPKIRPPAKLFPGHCKKPRQFIPKPFPVIVLRKPNA